jgi:hypothetical protein
MKYFILIILLLGSCGKRGKQGLMGVSGESGSDGLSSVTGEIVISVDRASTPWSDNNKTELEVDAVFQLPESFTINGITNTENGGWFDIILGDQTFCYQGKIGTKKYEFKYKKMINHSQGCDQNNEKDTGVISLIILVEANSIIQVIPRAPRYDVVEEFLFPYIGVENE